MIFPRKIIFGINAMDEFCETELPLYAKKNILIVSSLSIHKRKLEEKIINALKEAGAKTNLYLFDGGEPKPSDIDFLYKNYRDQELDLIIGIGGGSVIDVVKAGSLCFTQKTTCKEILTGAVEPRRSIKLFLLPTTAGTGAEVTNLTVLKTKEGKKAVVSNCLVSDLVVLDPIFIKSVPAQIRFLTMIDAASHALEALLSAKSNLVSDFYAVSALDIITGQAEHYLARSDQNNAQMDNNFQIAALQAGLAFGNAGVHLVHSFAYALCEQISLSHSQSVSIALLPALEYLIERKIDIIQKIEERKELINKLVSLLKSSSEDIYVVEGNIKDRKLVAQRVLANKRLMQNCPVEFSPEALLEITNKIYEKISAKKS